MSLETDVAKARAALKKRVTDWSICASAKEKHALYRDIKEAYMMIERAERWLASAKQEAETDGKTDQPIPR